ncbi:uncharacterized protein LOC115674348 [Syzygium oleosum]|uniref:uncharacterized protein LOC115674348 n=1 Tax=Syzygium oleosum TaxID=219896 RepID=UPI0011D1E3E7|nr:uncharacterized protein LOC115674348 [Syzygium oleosum]
MECTCEEMMEEVREELQGLERRHPYRLGHLKAELESFINCVESQHLLLHCNNRMPYPPFSSSFSVSTQESTCGTSKKRGAQEMEGTRAGPSPKRSVLKGTRAGPPPERSVFKGTRAGPSPKRSRIDVVLDRAKACLQKIQEFKASFR